MTNIRGRFKKEMADIVRSYTASIDMDWTLAMVDITGSKAHTRMLAKQGIITHSEAKKIIGGLEAILEEIKDGTFEPKPELEDVHMNIESRLIEKIGDVGRKLHTARSRNDQVATDMRGFILIAGTAVIEFVREMQEVLVDLAGKHLHTVMPGYTHLQKAQPVLLAHHLLAYYEMLDRDADRFGGCLFHTDVLPLGSGALAGVPYNIDRDSVADELEFTRISRNSIDAVSDRDFILEFHFSSALLMMHLSRLAEELVLWSTAEFDFIELDDAFTTGSSIMPQKKNPDVAELARGKTGRVYGNLIALLTTMKGLPLAYNRDMQEDKQGFFDTLHVVLSTLQVFTEMITTMRVNKGRMAAATRQGYLLATDIADYLVKKGEPFRTAHEITGKLVQYAIEKGKAFNKLSIEEYKQFSPMFENDVLNITVDSSIAARDSAGGTSKNQVSKQIAAARKRLQDARKE